MDIPRFSFDYTFLDVTELATQCIAPDEIESVFYDPATFYADWHKTDNIGYMIGYSLKNKFLSFTFELTGDGTVVRLNDVFLSNEFEVRTRYYGL